MGDHIDLPGDLGAAQYRHIRFNGLSDDGAEIIQLLHHEVASRGLLEEARDASVEACARWAVPKASFT